MSVTQASVRVILMLLLVWTHTSSELEEVEELREELREMGRQVMLSQFHTEEILRHSGCSGLKQVTPLTHYSQQRKQKCD